MSHYPPGQGKATVCRCPSSFGVLRRHMTGEAREVTRVGMGLLGQPEDNSRHNQQVKGVIKSFYCILCRQKSRKQNIRYKPQHKRRGAVAPWIPKAPATQTLAESKRKPNSPSFGWTTEVIYKEQRGVGGVALHKYSLEHKAYEKSSQQLLQEYRTGIKVTRMDRKQRSYSD